MCATDIDWLRSRSKRSPPACGSDSDGVRYLRLVPLSAESERFSRLTPDFLRMRAPNVRLLVLLLVSVLLVVAAALELVLLKTDEMGAEQVGTVGGKWAAAERGVVVVKPVVWVL